ncbi:MAG: tRNA epoxyqueuosine(34) reductase QueG [Ignavibacteria bacterium]|nr:tRNA epoxyqueuosine(34) reductase QueG [Ignavibacteria bacterium]
MSTAAERTARIKVAARALGFDAVGIARVEPLTEAYTHYEEWLRKGYHGAMGYMERNGESRRDVSAILPGARSVIVVARNYYTPHIHPDKAVGKIARYAWGDDYHVVLPPMLDALSEEVRTACPDAETKRYADTGPVLEKEWAIRAGIGWMGKNGNIIRRDIGSWFFLGVIITTAELDADEPMDDYCGSCTACLDQCPTKAIVEPKVVDATKCISYWTIEAKADVDIPLHIVDNLQGWIFGCDVCQDVCPWNRFQTPTSEDRFQPRDGVTVLSPSDLVDLQPARFIERFRHSPLKRPKLDGLKRNADALLNREQRIANSE